MNPNHKACGRCLTGPPYKVIHEAQPGEQPDGQHPFNLCRECWRKYLGFCFGAEVVPNAFQREAANTQLAFRIKEIKP